MKKEVCAANLSDHACCSYPTRICTNATWILVFLCVVGFGYSLFLVQEDERVHLISTASQRLPFRPMGL